MLTLTYNAARLFDIGLPLFAPAAYRQNHTFINYFQYVAIKDNPTLVFIGFSNDAVDRVFRMPSVPAVASACPCGGIPDWEEIMRTLVGSADSNS